jgi:predicted DNA-binding transcriptional regulator AlpA
VDVKSKGKRAQRSDRTDAGEKPPRVDVVPLLTKQNVARRLNTTPWTIDRYRKIDATFPQPIWLGPVSPRWEPASIELWLQTRRRGGVARLSPQHRVRRRQRSEATNG